MLSHTDQLLPSLLLIMSKLFEKLLLQKLMPLIAEKKLMLNH